MEYPKRHRSHVTETASFKRLDSCIPSHWIMRHVSERDYGIDCLVEAISKPDGPVIGDLLALQLKGTKGLDWNKCENPDEAHATFSGTSVATVNYWMGLPVPVFLCVHEQASDSVFFAPVKRQVRRRYRELQEQKSFGFEMWKPLALTTPESANVLYALYIQERAYPDFAQALADLLINRDVYVDYIEANIGRHFFLGVETPELLRFFKLYKNVETVARFSGIDWKIESLYDLFQQDKRTFGDGYDLLHEATHEKALRALAPIFTEAIGKGCRLVHEIERDYWARKEYLLLRYISEPGVDRWINEVEKRLKPIQLPQSGRSA